MRFFVTGCTGFIGIHLCRYLLKHGHEVTGLVRNVNRLPQDLKEQIQVVHGSMDIFRNETLVLPQVDIFVHLAAIINGNTPAEFMRFNHDALSEIFECLKRQHWVPKRFVFVSSLAAAGPNNHPVPRCEVDMPKPIDPYGEAKLSAEKLAWSQLFPITIIRPPVVIGPGDPAMLSVFRMVQNGILPLPAGKPQIISYIDVDDLVEALFIASNNSTAEHAMYFITNETPINTKVLAREIAATLNRKVVFLPVPKLLMRVFMWLSTLISILFKTKNTFDYRTYKQMLIPSFVCTSALFTQQTGWKATTELKETIRKTVKGYKERGWMR